MAVIDAAEATRAALYRVIATLGTYLAAEVATLNDTNNVVPTPAAEDWYIGTTEQIMLDVLSGKDVAGFVFVSDPVTESAQRTGAAGGVRGKLYTTPLRVVVLFKAPAGYVDYTAQTRPVIHSELVYHLADRLRGGVLNALYRRAQDAEAVHQIEVVAQYADVLTVNNQLTGRAVLDLEILQDVQVPMPL